MTPVHRMIAVVKLLSEAMAALYSYLLHHRKRSDCRVGVRPTILANSMQSSRSDSGRQNSSVSSVSAAAADNWLWVLELELEDYNWNQALLLVLSLIVAVASNGAALLLLLLLLVLSAVESTKRLSTNSKMLGSKATLCDRLENHFSVP